MKKFIKKIVLLLPILIILILTNYFVDPGNIFYKHGFYERGVAAIISSGKNVENLANYDERLLQKFYIDKLKKEKELVILGSSRAMQISSDIVSEKNMFNSSVSGASLEDLIAIYGIYREQNVLPKKIILGLDPWMMNRGNNQTRWKSLEDYYLYILNEVGILDKKKDLIQEKYLELVSLSYFQNAIDELKKGESVDYTATDLKYSKTNVKLADGSLTYNEEFRKRSVEEVRKIAVSYASSKPIYNLGGFSKIDEQYKREFEEFINLIQKDGVEVEFYFSPYHPFVYKTLMDSSDYRIVNEVEKYFTKFAIDKKINIRGSYNPEKVNCSEEDFYDGMHIKPEGVMKIYNTKTVDG